VTASHNRLGGRGDWALALPGHYIAGLMVLARTVVAGTRAWPVRTDLRDLPAAAAELSGRRYLALVPTQLARARRDPRVWAALATFHAVLVGGGRTEAGLLADARASGIPVVWTYGMSETCGGCVYDGRPLDGVEVVVADDGQIQIGGPVLFAGYRLRPELTRSSVVNGRLATADRGRWVDGRLEVLGRLDAVVITGGLNVDLAAVEALVQEWAGRTRSDAVVVGVPDAEWGTKIVAVTDGSGDLTGLQQFVRRSLPAYAAPRDLVQLKQLPRLASGKPDRTAIRALVIRGTDPVAAG
jgi:o-succinylbenzoate---CoA ligase